MPTSDPLIVIFGSSSDIGQRVARRLTGGGHRVRLVSRRRVGQATDDSGMHRFGDLSSTDDGGSLSALVADADVVVSCAHARFTSRILDILPQRDIPLVLVGSAWRYSRVSEPAAELVRGAEAAFLASGRRGVMLHPTMIYGGFQENNLRRLIKLLRKTRVLPLPGGGRHLVQPVHVDDVADAIIAATLREWPGANVIPIAGPEAMPWHDMARICARAMGRNVAIVPIPLSPVITVLELMRRTKIPLPLDPNILHRFRESTSLSIDEMRSVLGVNPRAFQDGLAELVAETD
jgi:nucleoside-diphosphate-sugar epimerase